MRNLIVAACCAALVGSVSVASAQTTGPAAQPTTVKASDPMNAHAKTMKKKHKAKKAAKPDAGMTKDTK